MQPEQPLIAPTLMGRGGDTALGMEQRSPEQRPPPAASPRAAVQVVLELIVDSSNVTRLRATLQADARVDFSNVSRVRAMSNADARVERRC